MASYQVFCITKPNANSSHEHITHIGYHDDRTKVIIPVKAAIRRIDANPSEFYVQVEKEKVFVTVVRIDDRDPYIKTIPDSTKRDNLLSLEQC
ncbi:Protein of unknown function [Pedobacter steynii]|uniref:DUF3892 domain-containing protein n=1 Tax=Pedobacter steynii TaxID=430522 RepID=A0A1H0ALE7_9SPHI|nr:DUF3892 domain-containing protein [Pedobacter steynii]NQX41322.1 DUF3892 domain-containing protein [Pedobacter steynii]SDN34360.1 Protein of unknown function [Pedobacter steynii]